MPWTLRDVDTDADVGRFVFITAHQVAPPKPHHNPLLARFSCYGHQDQVHGLIGSLPEEPHSLPFAG